MMSAYRTAATWIEQSLACLAEHQAAHDAPRSASVDAVAAVLEREFLAALA